jgi:2-polyprenyl-3-methyl-5-hydroxy-6-metoxy-1,4-benzoquinol methylase
MVRYRTALYKLYASGHTNARYGSDGLNWVVRQYSAWDLYYGRFLPAEKNARILDAGCGAGGFVHYLQSRGYVSTEGVDISEEQVAVARSLGVTGIYCEEIGQHLSTHRNSYDLIFARDLIEHLTKDEALDFLSAAHAAMRPGGVLVVQTPNGESPMSGRIRYGDLSHETTFTADSLSQAFFLTGFQGEEFFPVEPLRRSIRSFCRWMAWKVMSLGLRILFLVETGSAKGVLTQNLIAVAHKAPEAEPLRKGDS